MNKIPIFRWEADEDFRKSFYQKCEKIFDEAYLTNHSFVQEFEKKFATYSKALHVVATSNGTSALELMLRASEVRGKEVLMPTNTFIATAHAVLNAGATPVILDCEKDFLGLSFEQVERHLSPKTGAVLLVHTGGLISPDALKIRDLCKRKNIPLLEDCAHAHGAYLGKELAGHLGQAGAFSFHLTKLITMGEGGAVVTSDATLAQKMKSIRQFGVSEESPLLHVREGSNYKLSEMQALLGILDLERAPARIQKRQALAKIYQTRLAGSSWKTLTPPPSGSCGYYKQIVISPVDRTELEKKLTGDNINLTGGVYYFPLHRQPFLKELVANKNYPVADWFAGAHFCPPCYPELTEAEVHRVCDSLLELRK